MHESAATYSCVAASGPAHCVSWWLVSVHVFVGVVWCIYAYTVCGGVTPRHACRSGEPKEQYADR